MTHDYLPRDGLLLYNGRIRREGDMDPACLDFQQKTATVRRCVLEGIPNTEFDDEQRQIFEDVKLQILKSNVDDCDFASESLTWDILEEAMEEACVSIAHLKDHFAADSTTTDTSFSSSSSSEDK